ncbi:MAG: AAA family ATPase, partial [Hyphomicrobium sp.]|nr:AAA family ATPase [Hyphomicrobium sp.]
MTIRIVVAATGTDVGKTVFSAALTNALDGYYWKPVQAGLADETDAETVNRLTRVPESRILPERYRLNTPA